MPNQAEETKEVTDLNKRKIALVYIPDYMFINDEKTPYGLLCLKKILEDSDRYTVDIKDYNLILFDRRIRNSPSNMIATFDMISEELTQIGADGISFYTMCSNFYCCVPIAKRFKDKCPKTPCIFAGPHATCIARNILEQYPFIDYVSMGEGEDSVVPIFDSIFSGLGFNGVNGIAFREKDEINIQWNRKRRILGDKLPQIDLGKYFPVDPNSFINLEGGRGCPFSCTFCSTQKFWGNVFAVKPVKMLISEMKYYYSRYGANKFSIAHDLFTANRQYILTFCQSVCELSFKIEWGCSSRLDVLDEELIAAMIRSGCTDIYIGIESGSPRIQRKISKNLNLEDLCETLSLLLKGRISCILSFIYGYPFEEKEDVELTLQKIYEVKMLESDLSCAMLTIQLHRLTFLPGTVVAEEYYNELEFEGINTMSYFDEDLEIPSEICELILQNKTGFLNCYNLRENRNKFFNHLGDFVCLWFNLYYIHYRKTIDLVFRKFQKLSGFFEFVYDTDASFFLETSRFSAVYFEEDRDNLLYAAFEEFIANYFANDQIIMRTLYEEMPSSEKIG